MSRDIRAGAAYVELMLRDKRFKSGLARAGQQLKSFAAGAVKAGLAITAAAGAAGVAGVRQYIKLGDTLDKMSKRTGVAVERLSELRHAANQSGASVEELEKGFAGLSRALFDAGRGSSEANDALAAAGVTLEELQGLDPDKQMARIADGLKSITDESTRGAVAQRIFGRAGRQLLPMLRDGSTGMAKLQQEARDLGITMSTQAAEGSARLLDMLTILGKQFGTLAFEIGGAIAPVLEQVLPVIQSFGTITIDIVRQVGNFIGSNTSSVLQFFSEAYVSTFSKVTFAVTQWRDLFGMALVSAQLSVVRWANQTIYFLGTVVPGWLSWFGENWRDVFTDIGNYTSTVATNIWTNLKSLWQAIEGLFNGQGFNFEWTPLTEGFKSAIKELPQIAEREMGPLEARLQKELDGIAGAMVANFTQYDKEFRAVMADFVPQQLESLKIDPDQFDALRNGGNVSAAKDKIFATFSAAAAVAQGQGASKEDKVVDAVDRQTKKIDEWGAKQTKAIEDSLQMRA